MMKNKITKITNIAIMITFLSALFIPFSIWLLSEDKTISSIEKRTLAVLPKDISSINDFIKFPDNFNKYFSDHFGLREILTNEYFKVKNKIEADNVSSDVTMGKDGWMFLGRADKGYNKFDDPMGDVMNINLYSGEELKKFAQSIATIEQWFKKRGILYILVIAPNAHTIYFEKLPDYIKKYNNQSATDQLVSYVQKNTSVPIVDLRQPLLDAKQKQQLYFKTDTHWNSYGANIAQYEIIKKINAVSSLSIDATLLQENEFDTSKNMPTGDLAGFAKIDNITEIEPLPIFKNKCDTTSIPATYKYNEEHTKICKEKQQTAIIFRDSFFIAVEPYFDNYFGKATYIWEKLNFKKINVLISKEKPDVVIEEWIERTLPYVQDSSEFME
ncbi:MAG: hypothetical protein WC656_12760 [Sulfurimonas sp.]|jgi:hypothetical protein